MRESLFLILRMEEVRLREPDAMECITKVRNQRTMNKNSVGVLAN